MPRSVARWSSPGTPSAPELRVRRPLIIDCDPGVDDAIALLLAFAMRRQFDLLGITTVAGNVSAELTARNACVIREIVAATDIPIFRGDTRPLVREPVEAGHFHGPSGLGDLHFTAPCEGPQTEAAVDFLTRTLAAAAPRSVTLVITGPCTHLGRVLGAQPSLAAALREIALMGGARSAGGNITASAEYNIFADPHAARAVFRAGVPIHAFGLDATHQVRSTPARIERLRALGSRSALTAAQLLEFSSALPGNGSRDTGAPLHDPCPIAWLLEPSLFEFRAASVDVECDSPLTIGHTAVEFRPRADTVQNVQWAVGADAEGVFALLERALA